MKSSRRKFLHQLSLLGAGALVYDALPSYALPLETEKKKYRFKISLAQWSLHKQLFANKITTLDFPGIAKNKFGIEAVEFVSQFFQDKANDLVYLDSLKAACEKASVKPLLIMIDGEGSLAETNENARIQAVENHFKWVTAAHRLGCHSIRVNLHGNGDAEQWEKASIASLQHLTSFAEKFNIHILVENHGGFSSNGTLLANVMKAVNKPHCGTLPDFGNFCVRREKGDLWESPCVDEYDKYKGVEEMLPFAKGVSAKSLDFDTTGKETTIDYVKMLALVKNSKYQGYVGIEYEGNRLSEEEGIWATKKLLERVRKEIS